MVLKSIDPCLREGDFFETIRTFWLTLFCPCQLFWFSEKWQIYILATHILDYTYAGFAESNKHTRVPDLSTELYFYF